MKHTISLLVENHYGVLSKISGMFSRRGFNIDSLAVGTTEQPDISRITIVVDGDDYTTDQVTKQLNKIIPVIKVKILEEHNFVARVLTLIKVNINAKTRTELTEIVNIIHAQIVDASSKYIIVQYCGTAEQTETCLGLLKPYGIKEIVKTGTVAMEKGAEKLESKKQ